MSALTSADSRQITDTVKTANAIIAIWQFIAANASLFREGIYGYSYEFSAGFYGENAKAELVQAMNTIRRHYPGAKVDKKYETSQFRVTIQLPDSYLYFTLYTARGNVCTKVETGEMVTREVPDYSLAPTKTVTEPVIEWVCDPILAD